NQGMILGMSAFVYGFSVGIKYTIGNLNDFKGGEAPQRYIIPKESYEKGVKGEYDSLIKSIVEKELETARSKGALSVEWDIELSPFVPIHADVSFVNLSDELDIEKFKKWNPNFETLEFITNENGKYIVGHEVEKMSKSKFNVVNPDDICEEYGADTLRLYEMFLGPLEQAKPWNTAGITGVYGFLKKLWRLYADDNGVIVTDDEPTKEMYKSLHKTIKKVTEDIEHFSFNTSVSQFMICVNELQQQKCRHRAILEPLAIILSPYAPHIAEELWSLLGHEGSIAKVA